MLYGHMREKVHFGIVVGARGQIAGVERLQTELTSRANRLMVLPGLPDQRTTPRFLWGRSKHVLGVRKRRGRPGEFLFDLDAFDAFWRLHAVALAEAGDTSLHAFLRFLAGWRAESFTELPHWPELIDSTLVFRFQYDELFLHQRDAARRIWSRLLEAEG